MIKNIVLSSGSIYGISYLGCLKILEEKNNNPNNPRHHPLPNASTKNKPHQTKTTSPAAHGDHLSVWI